MNILVTGCNGQLGKEFQKIASLENGNQWFFTDIDTLDISNKDAVNQYFIINKINICINCAAYTNVDKAEEDEEKTYLINADAVNILAKTCKSNNSILIHISTDYVFNGLSDHPYLENETMSPLSIYAKSKAKGDSYIFSSGCSYIILRSSWLYSSSGKNFVKTMLRLGSEKESISVVNDQKGNPTWAYDLARAIMVLIQTNGNKTIHEVFNFSNEGTISWYDFACAIFEIGKIKCEVRPVSTEQYGSKIHRPAFSALDKTKIKKFADIKVPYWKDSLIKCMEEIKKNNY